MSFDLMSFVFGFVSALAVGGITVVVLAMGAYKNRAK